MSTASLISVRKIADFMLASFFLFGLKIIFAIFSERTIIRWMIPLSEGPLRKKPISSGDSVVVSQVTQAIKSASSRIPGRNTCLMEALAAQCLLYTKGLSAELCIGVRLDATKTVGNNQTFLAHAWLKWGNQVVLGEIEDLAKFQLLKRGETSAD